MRVFRRCFRRHLSAGALPDDVAARAEDLLKPQPLDELEELLQDIIMAWGGKPRLSVFPAPSIPERCTEAALLLCAELAERFDTGIHTHLLETRKQADLAQQRFGTTIVQQLAKMEVLSDRWSCAHSIWLTGTDITLMAEKQVTAVLNPESNARLGTGLANIPARCAPAYRSRWAATAPAPTTTWCYTRRCAQLPWLIVPRN